jgi:hypothetical protein
MGCGASSGGDAGPDLGAIKDETETIMNLHLDPVTDAFDAEVEPALLAAGMPSWDKEHELEYAKATEVRAKIWADGKYQARLDEAEAAARVQVEADVWPDVIDALPPSGLKRTIGEKVGRKAVDSARDGAVQSAKEGALESPLINGLMRKNIDAIAHKHADPYVAGPFRELQDRKLSGLGKEKLDDLETCAALKKFHKECVKEADITEASAAALAEFEADIIPIIHLRLVWKGTPLDSMKGKIAVKGIDATKTKTVEGAIRAILAASEKDRISALDEKEKAAAEAAEKKDAEGDDEGDKKDDADEGDKKDDADDADKKDDADDADKKDDDGGDAKDE